VESVLDQSKENVLTRKTRVKGNGGWNPERTTNRISSSK